MFLSSGPLAIQRLSHQRSHYASLTSAQHSLSWRTGRKASMNSISWHSAFQQHKTPSRDTTFQFVCLRALLKYQSRVKQSNKLVACEWKPSVRLDGNSPWRETSGNTVSHCVNVQFGEACKGRQILSKAFHQKLSSLLLESALMTPCSCSSIQDPRHLCKDW